MNPKKAKKKTRPDDLAVMVLGVGGNVSQGILKALELSKLHCRVVGGCISPKALGLYTVDSAYVTPQVSDPGFINWLIETCKAERVRAILSGVEPVLELLALNAEKIRNETGAVCIVSEPAKLRVGSDKLDTCQWLESHGFNHPRYAASEDKPALEKLLAECGYPLIAKPRKGKGGHGIITIHDPTELAYAASFSNFVVEECVGEPDSEYTAGCFCDRAGAVRGVFVVRRELHSGTTYRAEAGEFPEVRAEATRIASALGPLGPCNIQMRMSRGRAVCFEINVRFSGTTPMRARLGFNEVEAALEHFVLGKPARDLPLITRGVMLRYWNEMYVDPGACAVLQKTGKLCKPRDHELLVEDYGVRS